MPVLALDIAAPAALASNTGFKLNYQLEAPPGQSQNNAISLPFFYFPARVDSALPSDAGPDRKACTGQTLTIGRPGDPLVTYQWTPATVECQDHRHEEEGKCSDRRHLGAGDRPLVERATSVDPHRRRGLGSSALDQGCGS